MKLSKLELSALTASRLNHDYVAPISAMVNSVELMRLSSKDSEEYIQLIEESVESAITLVQFYRYAFGYCEASDIVRREDFLKKFAAMASQSRIESALNIQEDSLQKTDAKLIALAFMCLKSSFSRLNSCSVEQGKNEWQLLGEGSGTKNAEGIRRAEGFWNGTEKVTSSQVHFPIFLASLDEFSYTLKREYLGNDQMLLTFQK